MSGKEYLVCALLLLSGFGWATVGWASKDNTWVCPPSVNCHCTNSSDSSQGLIFGAGQGLLSCSYYVACSYDSSVSWTSAAPPAIGNYTLNSSSSATSPHSCTYQAAGQSYILTRLYSSE